MVSRARQAFSFQGYFGTGASLPFSALPLKVMGVRTFNQKLNMASITPLIFIFVSAKDSSRIVFYNCMN